MQVVQLGAGNFAVMWIGAASDGSLQLQGTYFALPPDLAAEVVLPAGDGWAPIPIAPIVLPKDFTGEFNLSAMGEDNPDIVVTFTANDGDGTGIFAVHVDGNATGAVDQVFQHSGSFLVNTTTAGNQSGGSVAGTVGDRAIITYLDEDSGDVLARMVDCANPVNSSKATAFATGTTAPVSMPVIVFRAAPIFSLARPATTASSVICRIPRSVASPACASTIRKASMISCSVGSATMSSTVAVATTLSTAAET